MRGRGLPRRSRVRRGERRRGCHTSCGEWRAPRLCRCDRPAARARCLGWLNLCGCRGRCAPRNRRTSRNRRTPRHRRTLRNRRTGRSRHGSHLRDWCRGSTLERGGGGERLGRQGNRSGSPLRPKRRRGKRLRRSSQQRAPDLSFAARPVGKTSCMDLAHAFQFLDKSARLFGAFKGAPLGLSAAGVPGLGCNWRRPRRVRVPC